MSKIGTRTIVEFFPGWRDDEVVVEVANRKAYVDNRSPIRVKTGEIWEVEIVGENPRKSVYFLRPQQSFQQMNTIRAKVVAGSRAKVSEDMVISGVALPYKIASEVVKKNQIWEFAIDHQNKQLIPIHRIATDDELEQERVESVIDRMQQIVNTHTKYLLLRANEYYPGQVFIDIAHYCAHGESKHAISMNGRPGMNISHLTHETCENFVLENINEWIDKVEKRRATTCVLPKGDQHIEITDHTDYINDPFLRRFVD